MSKPTIIVVEDDPDILHLLTFNIQSSGFEVLTSMDGNEALSLIREHLPDLIILDLMLPGLDGLEVCRHLKRDQKTQTIPLIMLTAKSEEVDRIVGLELGADDYVVKPFSPRELVLRIRAILRRAAAETNGQTFWHEAGLRIDFDGHMVTIHDEEVALTATEFKLFASLVQNAGKVQTREQLLHRVWGYEFDGYARTVDTHIRRLRQKLGEHAAWIETVRSVGYRFHI
jgi:two-component system phosphate regulon response regulator PhoB